ncbi:eCIS core domain-containing protein [Flavobacterium sp. MMS24-S5]|uniref:eCIS core domain-containing protein n=1 Tax=Flavobacterium sp. MMS24-S5 TaxID=3416605 RepID=UPI003D05ED66
MEYSTDKTKTQSAANSSGEKVIQNKARELQDNRPVSVLQKKVNNTGLPDNLKSGIENLSGHSMDDVKVHYNSDKPAQLNAHAYAQGSDIHLASGQEKHLPHEAWHVVQQKQGRVKPTIQMKGKVNVNDDKGLEKEADVMGAKALQRKQMPSPFLLSQNQTSKTTVAQLNEDEEHGLVPPSTHGRSQSYKSPADPASTTKGHHHSVPRKNLTRFERMIDRIGRILATSTNVHVAVALDDNTLVLSVNQESPEQEKKLEKVAAKLKNIIHNQDPLAGSSDQRITGGRRTKDIAKTKNLLEGAYTDEETGVETNKEVSSQLKRLIVAINAGVIDTVKYHSGTPGIYVVPTSMHPSDKTQNMHGELKVTGAILDRRKNSKYNEKDVYIGGTLADCFACNASHKMMNEEIRKQLKDWSFYSGGTHGGLFVGYRASEIVAKNKARFHQLTGEEVVGGDIPKVNSIDKESDSSLNYDSDSEAEDAVELSAYAKQRNKLKSIEKDLRASSKKLKQFDLEIQAASSHLELLRQEMQKLTPYVQEESFKRELERAKQEYELAQKESTLTEQLLRAKEQEIQEALKDLESTKQNIQKDIVVVGTTGRKPKRGIPVTFREDTLTETGWEAGKSFNELALKNLSIKYAYKQAYDKANSKEIREQVELAKVEFQKAEKSVTRLNLSLLHAKAPLDRLEVLPSEIHKTEENIKKLEASRESMNQHIIAKDEERVKTKADQKLAANHGKVKAVQGRLDWLNQSAITADQTDGD